MASKTTAKKVEVVAPTRDIFCTKDEKVCVQCQRKFLEDENKAGACLYHNGRFLEYGGGFEIMEEAPVSLGWSCCDETSKNKQGCKRGKHAEGTPDGQVLTDVTTREDASTTKFGL